MAATLPVTLMALLARWADRAPGIACPLCRSDLRYDDGDNLAAHALAVHDFEDLYDWTREQYDRAGSPCMVSLLDTAFDTIQTLTTEYGSGSHGWHWRCTRCNTITGNFPTSTAASRDRLHGHRCPL